MVPNAGFSKYEPDLMPIWKKKAQTGLRHEPRPREEGGAVCWPTLIQRMNDPHPQTRSWNFDKWLDAMHWTNLDLSVVLTCRETPVHQSKFTVAHEELIHSSIRYCLIPYDWKVNIYHTGSTPRMAHTDLDAGYPFDLESAQDGGLKIIKPAAWR